MNRRPGGLDPSTFRGEYRSDGSSRNKNKRIRAREQRTERRDNQQQRTEARTSPSVKKEGVCHSRPQRDEIPKEVTIWKYLAFSKERFI
jgi:hypothetical protein